MIIINYAIFRSEPIYTLNDLAQIGSHNKREKKAYNSNPNIKLELTKDNIEIVPLKEKYVKGFHSLVKDYEKEHNERMKTEREDRKKTFNQMLNKSKNVVADELLFTTTHKFFDNMSKEEIKEWADTCMKFVYEDLGYTKGQVLHATVHLDEETPYLHCVVVPLIKKLDKRTNTERYTISKKAYIKDKIHLSELQDKYHKRLTDKGYDLERGIKGSTAKHQKVRELKNTTRYYEQKVKVVNTKIDKAMKEFNEKQKTTKNIPFNKTHVLVEKDTFDSMNKVIEKVPFNSNDLIVITVAKKLCAYVIAVTEKSPKKFRGVFVNCMQNNCLDTIEYLLEVNFIRMDSATNKSKRENYQKEAIIKLKLLGYIAMVAESSGCILTKQYKQISMQLAETINLIVAWKKSDDERWRKRN